jgi:hypothetical protein
MRRDAICKCKSSFLSCEKDIEKILKKLFVESHPYSEDLKRLLIINTKDCLDNKTSEVYNKYLREATLPYLVEHGFIKIVPKMLLPEHEEIKSYIIISFDNFTPSGNPQFRDCVVHFDIICHTDYWDLGDYRLRPFKIAGIIDGLLDKSRLSGIGTFQFSGCNELVLDETLSGYTIQYSAIHGTDDVLPSAHGWIEK